MGGPRYSCGKGTMLRIWHLCRVLCEGSLAVSRKDLHPSPRLCCCVPSRNDAAFLLGSLLGPSAPAHHYLQLEVCSGGTVSLYPNREFLPHPGPRVGVCMVLGTSEHVCGVVGDGEQWGPVFPGAGSPKVAPLQRVPMAITETMMEIRQRKRMKARVNLFNSSAVRQGCLGRSRERPLLRAHPTPFPQ